MDSSMRTHNAFKDVLTVVLAGGRGERLYPLTKNRSKPAVPFGGPYRIIDFTLSNCLNSGFRRIKVLTQYMSHSLDRHLKQGWSIFCRELDEYIDSVPPQQQYKEGWYRGTADAIFQNIYLLEQIHPRYVLILSGDHVYKMNYAEMLRAHLENDADLTVASVEVESRLAVKTLGVLQVDKNGRIVDFEEKPERPKPSPFREGYVLVNMGIYIFNTESLVRNVVADAKRDTSHDFGRDVIPSMIPRERCFAHNFVDGSGGEILYWRDIGTLDNYFEASMDLLSAHPHFDLYDPEWPVRTYMGQYPPVKLMRSETPPPGQDGFARAKNSIISPGCVIDGARVTNCVLSPGVYIGPGAEVEDSVILHDSRIGAGCRIRRAVIDGYAEIGERKSLGYDREEDTRHFQLTDSGILLVPRGYVY